jgi:hypothetical protein
MSDDTAYGMAFGLPLAAGEVIAEDVRWSCAMCGSNGLGAESLNNHSSEHLSSVTKWRQITGIRLDSVSLDIEPGPFSIGFEAVREIPRPVYDIPLRLTDADRVRLTHGIARIYGVPCTLLGLPWHPGCRETPRRSRMHAMYHARRS